SRHGHVLVSCTNGVGECATESTGIPSSAHDEISPPPTVLLMREIDLGCGSPDQTIVMDIANHSDNLILLRIIFVLVYVKFLDAFTKGVFVRKITLRKRLVHDG